MKRHASAESIRRIIETIIAAVGVTNLGVLRDSVILSGKDTVCIFTNKIISMGYLYFLPVDLPL